MLSTPTTGRPDSSRRRAKLKPMKPAAPVTRTGSADMGDLTLDFHRRRRDRVHQAAGFRPDTEVAKGVLRMTREVKGTPPFRPLFTRKWFRVKQRLCEIRAASLSHRREPPRWASTFNPRRSTA